MRLVPRRQLQLSTRDRWRLALSSCGVLALIAVLYREPPPPEFDISDLALSDSIPDSVLVLLDPALRDSTQELGRIGLYYRTGRFHAATRLLEPLAEGSPTGSELLLLGSSLFLQDRHTDAVLTLRRAASQLEGVPLEECRWILAQTYLARGEPDPARDELNWLADRGAHRARDAEQQRSSLEETTP